MLAAKDCILFKPVKRFDEKTDPVRFAIFVIKMLARVEAGRKPATTGNISSDTERNLVFKDRQVESSGQFPGCIVAEFAFNKPLNFAQHRLLGGQQYRATRRAASEQGTLRPLQNLNIL